MVEFDKKIFKIKYGELVRYRGKQSEVEIPQGVTSIGKCAFSKRKNISKVIISEGVKEIGIEAFLDCSNLEFVHIPSTVHSIYEEAFEKCLKIKELIIPATVKYISRKVFEGWTFNQTIVLEGGKAQAENFSPRWLKNSKAQVVYK